MAPRPVVVLCVCVAYPLKRKYGFYCSDGDEDDWGPSQVLFIFGRDGGGYLFIDSGILEMQFICWFGSQLTMKLI